MLPSKALALQGWICIVSILCFAATDVYSADPNENWEPREVEGLLGKLKWVNGWKYNPADMVRAVNRLQTLGKDRALGVIEKFAENPKNMRKHENANGALMALMAVLFQIPEGSGCMPPMLIGQPSPQPPKDKRQIPRFPIVIVEDIPFMIVSGYTLFGQQQSVGEHIAFYRKNGKLRKKGLLPSNTPVRALTSLFETTGWIFEGNNSVKDSTKQMLLTQIIRMYDDNLGMKEYDLKDDLAESNLSDVRIEEVVRLYRWDESEFGYVKLKSEVSPGLDLQIAPEPPPTPVVPLPVPTVDEVQPDEGKRQQDE